MRSPDRPPSVPPSRPGSPSAAPPLPWRYRPASNPPATRSIAPRVSRLHLCT
jgi:hypothetical protein